MHLALLTDFGYQDPYAGMMEATLLRLFPSLRIIHLSHGVPPGNLKSGAWMLSSAWNQFPTSCIFCAVVDPGVGTDRQILVARWGQRWLVAPDNGLISLLWKYQGQPDFMGFVPREEIQQRLQVGQSQTFEGRDIFAPLAGWIASGKDILFAKPLDTKQRPVLLDIAEPIALIPHDQMIQIPLQILHADHFGNLIWDFHKKDLDSHHLNPDSAYLKLGTLEFRKIQQTFADVEPSTPLLYFGSSDHLECGLRENNLRQQLKIPPLQWSRQNHQTIHLFISST